MIDLTKDLQEYCANFLEIEGKDGKIKPFVFNKAQAYLHSKIEEQRKRKGFVRIYLVKGRQQGCTTYISARFYHKAIYNRGTKVFILSHEAKTTGAIFKKIKKYQSNIEKVFMNAAPKIKSSNNNQLIFEDYLSSEYSIGTAGNENVGRGFTIQLLHLSEAAYYEKPEDIDKGLVQTVSDEKNTEIIFETTANGQNNFFEKIQDVINNPDTSDYEIVFIPWYWQDEYTALPPNDFVKNEEELELVKKYGLTDGQLFWRRKKIQVLNSISAFKQEYPFTLDEAFEYSGVSLVKPEYVTLARVNDFKVNTMMPKILGVDAAQSGDRTIFVIRQGRKVIYFKKYSKMTGDLLLSLCIDIINKFNISMMFIDVAYGQQVADILCSMGYYRKVKAVNFKSKPLNADLYLNKRAEIICSVAEWFKEGADIPDSQEFVSDILAIPDYKLTAGHKIQIVSKEEIKKQLKKSTDIMDALALTFAFPVIKEENLNLNLKKENKKSKINALNVKSRRNRHGKKR